MVEITRAELRARIVETLTMGPLDEVEMRIDELVAELVPDEVPPLPIAGYTGPVIEE